MAKTNKISVENSNRKMFKTFRKITIIPCMYTDLLTTKIIYKTHGCWVIGYGEVLFVFGLFEINSYYGIILLLNHGVKFY